MIDLKRLIDLHFINLLSEWTMNVCNLTDAGRNGLLFELFRLPVRSDQKISAGSQSIHLRSSTNSASPFARSVCRLQTRGDCVFTVFRIKICTHKGIAWAEPISWRRASAFWILFCKVSYVWVLALAIKPWMLFMTLYAPAISPDDDFRSLLGPEEPTLPPKS